MDFIFNLFFNLKITNVTKLTLIYLCKRFSDVNLFTYLCFDFIKLNIHIPSQTMETEKDRIEKIIEKEGLNATQFASEIGIKSPTLSHILNGRNNPSLDVLKRILDRYREISSDWLILGVGPMVRGIKQPQALTLFDNDEASISRSAISSEKTVQNSGVENDVKQKKTDANLIDAQNSVVTSHTSTKVVKKIIVYYDDNTFQEFEGK